MRTDETPQRDIDVVFWRDLANSVEVVSIIIYLLLVAPYEPDKNRGLLQLAESEVRKVVQLMATHHPRFDVDHFTG
jgi:hypothetical protein